MNKETRDFSTAEAIRWIVENNPEVDPLDIGFAGQPVRILSSKPAEELKLPEGWYYNEKNGITNKHNSSTGLFSCIGFELKE